MAVGWLKVINRTQSSMEVPPMVILGIILMIAGFILSLPVLWTIGIILLVIGLILLLLGAVGREVGGRRWYY